MVELCQDNLNCCNIHISLYIYKDIKIDTVCMFLLTKYQYYIYVYIHFLAFSTPALWCRVFRSRLFSRPNAKYDNSVLAVFVTT